MERKRVRCQKNRRQYSTAENFVRHCWTEFILSCLSDCRNSWLVLHCLQWICNASGCYLCPVRILVAFVKYHCLVQREILGDCVGHVSASGVMTCGHGLQMFEVFERRQINDSNPYFQCKRPAHIWLEGGVQVIKTIWSNSSIPPAASYLFSPRTPSSLRIRFNPSYPIWSKVFCLITTARFWWVCA